MLLQVKLPVVSVNSSWTTTTTNSNTHAETKTVTTTQGIGNSASNDTIDHNNDLFVIQLGQSLIESTTYDGASGAKKAPKQQMSVADAAAAALPIVVSKQGLLHPASLGDPLLKAKIAQYLTEADRVAILLQDRYFHRIGYVTFPIQFEAAAAVTPNIAPAVTPNVAAPPPNALTDISYVYADNTGDVELDSNRFIPVNQLVEALGPDFAGQPSPTNGLQVSHTVTDTDAYGTGSGSSVSVLVGGQVSFFGITAGAHGGFGIQVNHTDTTSSNNGTTQSAQASLASSTACFDAITQVYYDKAFTTFAFVPLQTNTNCQTPQMTGMVIDPSGNPVAGAQVQVIDRANVAHLAVTNSAGQYRVNSLSSLSGAFSVIVEGGDSTTVTAQNSPLTIETLHKGRSTFCCIKSSAVAAALGGARRV